MCILIYNLLVWVIISEILKVCHNIVSHSIFPRIRLAFKLLFLLKTVSVPTFLISSLEIPVILSSSCLFVLSSFTSSFLFPFMYLLHSGENTFNIFSRPLVTAESTFFFLIAWILILFFELLFPLCYFLISDPSLSICPV